MDTLRDKGRWFSELSDLWPGQCLSLQVDDVIVHEKSKFQDIMVIKTKEYGNVLILDGVIQCTVRDEFAYQEMITHLPLNSHPKPEQVLVIGGGDGGVLRELMKHPGVQKVTMCEIDQRVIEVSKKHLPYMSRGSFEDPRLELNIADGFDFMAKHQGEFDVIITDSSDPIGPASSLFQKSYYELMKKALKEDGIVCAQGECLWLHKELIRNMRDFCRELYPVVDYSYCTIPTYPSGQIGFMLCSTNPKTNFRKPLRELSEKEMDDMKLQYYTPEIHKASFVLPRFATQYLKD